MIIHISSTVIIKGLSSFLTDRVKKDLTFKNPEYQKRVKRGRFIPKDLAPTIELWRPVGEHIRVPRGYMNRLLYIIQGKEHTIVDNTVLPPLDVNFKGTPRPYGEKAVQECLKFRYGVLEASTGAGKTVMAIDYITRRKSTALILVHSKELLDQWIERLKEFTDLTSIGSIGAGSNTVSGVTVGIINSVYKRAVDLRDEFGIVIYDECHRGMGSMWVMTINSMRPRYHLGLSATPFRSDGMTTALYRLLGPKIHKVDPKELVQVGAVMNPRVCRVQTEFNYYFHNDYSKMISVLVNNAARNKEIVKAISHDVLKYKEPVMVVSDRVSHCETILAYLNAIEGVRPVVVHGSIDRDERIESLARVKTGDANVLIATANLLGEGFDAPNLSAVFLTTPMKFNGRVIQTIGRILRPEENKFPRVYDFRDNRVEVLRWSGFSRDRVYKERGWE